MRARKKNSGAPGNVRCNTIRIKGYYDYRRLLLAPIQWLLVDSRSLEGVSFALFLTYPEGEPIDTVELRERLFFSSSLNSLEKPHVQLLSPTN